MKNFTNGIKYALITPKISFFRFLKVKRYEGWTSFHMIIVNDFPKLSTKLYSFPKQTTLKS